MKDLAKKFLFALELLAKSPKQPQCNTLLKYCRILGWNFSLKYTPAMAVDIWNTKLPKNLRIDKGSFDDKGETPDWLETWEKREIAGLLGIETEFGKPNFQCMWEWRIANPETSKVELERRLKAINKNKVRDNSNPYGYGSGRYMGD